MMIKYRNRLDWNDDDDDDTKILVIDYFDIDEM